MCRQSCSCQLGNPGRRRWQDDLTGWAFASPFMLLYVVFLAFPILAFQPKTGLVHLPPTVHTTFAGEGFVVCSFVPRVVDFHERAIPCPYPHSSPDCDEVLFYVEGNFTSRKGVGPASMTLHPRGLAHGPHPGTYEASKRLFGDDADAPDANLR